MRKRTIALAMSILMLVCLFPAVSVAEPEEFERIPLTEEHFPDANFRAWILAQDGWTEEENGVTYLLGRVRETDYIDCSGQGIADLAGIQYFPNLRHLIAGERYEENENGDWILAGTNALTAFDPALTPNLVSLSITLSDVTELDVSSLTDLEELWCGGNGMTSLTLGNLTHLEYLNAGDLSWYEGNDEWGSKGNRLSSLDLSGVPNLRELNVNGNRFTALDASGFANLERLECANNPITQLTLPDHMISGWIGLNDVEPTDNSDGTWSFDLSTLLDPTAYSFERIDTSEWDESKTLDPETGVVTFAYRPNQESFCIRETIVHDENWTEDLGIDLIFSMPDGLEWSVIGNICGTEWDTDFPMTEIEPDVWQSEELVLYEGEMLKVRYGQSWDYNYGIDPYNWDGSEPVVCSSGGQNLVIPADGTYVVTLTLGDPVFITLTNQDGETVLPGTEQNGGQEMPDDLAWTVIGSIFGTSWNTDFQMIETEPGVWQSGAWALHEGEEFKVRGNCDWNYNYGMNGEPGGANCVVEADGTYVITLNLNDPVTLTWELTDREPEEPVIVQQSGDDPYNPDDPDYPYVTDEGIDPATAFNFASDDIWFSGDELFIPDPSEWPEAPAYEDGLDGVPIDEAHFPDANFREWILRKMDHETFTDEETGEETYLLTDEQRWNVTVIDCRGRHIESLAGIEYFPNLEWLYCGRMLTEYVPEYAFWLYASNPITELDLSGNPKLTRLCANYCKLPSIDLSRNPGLTHLNLFCNELTELDLSGNPNIEKLNITVNDIAQIDLSVLPNLKEFCCGFTKLVDVDLSGRDEMIAVQCHNIDTLETLNLNGCANLNPEGCSIHDNYALRELRCRSCGLSEIPGNISNLEILDCGGNPQFTSLDMADLRELRELYCDNCSLYRLELSMNKKITILSCSYNHLKELQVALVPGSTPDYGGDFYAIGQTAVCAAGMEPDGNAFAFDMRNLVAEENLDRIMSVENAVYDSETGIAAFDTEADTLVYHYNALSGTEASSMPGSLDMPVTVTLNVEMPALPEGAIPIDKEHFPDDNFRNWILKTLTPYYTEDAFGRKYLTDEREGALYFDLTGLEVASIEGLKYFPNAFGLFLGDGYRQDENGDWVWHSNYLTEVDLSQNKNLGEVHLNHNQLTELDVSGLPRLQWLNCSDNQLSVIDVSHNANLAVLWCGGNGTHTLNLPNGYVHVYPNMRGEGEEQMNQLARVECDGNQLTALDLSGLPVLKELSCENNELTVLDLSDSNGFGLLDCDDDVDITLPEGMTFRAQMVVNDGEATYRCTSLAAAIDKITGRDGITDLGEVQSAYITLFGDQEGHALVFAADQYKTVVIDLNGHTYTSWDDPALVEYDNNVTVINGEIVVRKVPSFASHTLVLSGKIGVNFFMELPEIDGVDYADSYMTFAISGGGSVSDDPVPYDANFISQTNGYYGFTCYVTSIQMADTITATFHYGDGLTVSGEYSVKQYIESFDTYMDSFDQATINLVHALADFGHYVQLFLSDARNWTIGTDDDQFAEMSKFYQDSYDTDAIKTAVADYAIGKTLCSDITKVSYTLLTDSDTAIYLYFKPAADYSGSFTATVNGESAAATKQKDGRYLVTIPNIGAHKLGETFTVKAVTTNGETTVTVSALSYVKGVLDAYTSESTKDVNARNAVAAIYAYYEAAAEFRRVHP